MQFIYVYKKIAQHFEETYSQRLMVKSLYKHQFLLDHWS